MVVILVCGDRNWSQNNTEPILRELFKYMDQSVRLIHGGCEGVDVLAGLIGQKLGFTVKDYPVPQEEWTRLGNRAGPLRNKRMITEEKVDLVLAFHPDIANSRGTKDMIRQATQAGIPVHTFAC
jgi:hypothetical protein